MKKNKIRKQWKETRTRAKWAKRFNRKRRAALKQRTPLKANNKYLIRGAHKKAKKKTRKESTERNPKKGRRRRSTRVQREEQWGKEWGRWRTRQKSARNASSSEDSLFSKQGPPPFPLPPRGPLVVLGEGGLMQSRNKREVE